MNLTNICLCFLLNKALIIHFVSYVNKIIINLAVDTSVIPDPHLLCDDLVESLNIIKLAALEKGVHKMEVWDMYHQIYKMKPSMFEDKLAIMLAA